MEEIMKLMQKIVGFTALAVMAGSVQAGLVTMSFTGDNWMIGQTNLNNDDPYTASTVASGGVGDPATATDWTKVTTTQVELANGDYFAHFMVADNGGAAGFIGEISTWDKTIQSGAGWEVCDTPVYGGIFPCNSTQATWSDANSYGAYGVSPWNTSVNYDFTGAEWIWSDDNENDNLVVLRVAFSVVPEPSIIALFGLGLIGLGFARRKTRS
jgi:hypothetical protein